MLVEQLRENGEAFLREVLIMSEHFSNVSFEHRVHGDAVGKTISKNYPRRLRAR
jgi:hypothetical protein